MKNRRLWYIRSALIIALAAVVFVIPASARFVARTVLHYSPTRALDPQIITDDTRGFDVVFTAPILVTPGTAPINANQVLSNTEAAQVTLENAPAGWYAFRLQGAGGGDGAIHNNGTPGGGPAQGGRGGEGATISGVFWHDGGASLVVVAGRGGGHSMWNRPSGNAEPGGGQAMGRNATETQRSGGGGGFSGIFNGSMTQEEAVAIAGGGGGGGGGGGDGSNSHGAHAGNGGTGGGGAANAGQSGMPANVGNTAASIDRYRATAGTGGGGGGGGGSIWALGTFGAGGRTGGNGGVGGSQDGTLYPHAEWHGIGGGGGSTPNENSAGNANWGGDGGRNIGTHPWRNPTITGQEASRGSPLQGGNSRNYATGGVFGANDGNSAGGGGGWMGGEAGFYNGTGPGAGGGGGSSFMRAGILPLGTLWNAVAGVNHIRPTVTPAMRTPSNAGTAGNSSRNRGAANGYVWILYLGEQVPTDAWLTN